MFHIRIILVLLIFLLFSNSNSRILTKDHKILENQIPLAEFALLITRRYISTKTNIVIIKESCSNHDNNMKDFHQRLLDFYLKNFDSMMTLELHFNHFVDHPWNYYIFIVDSLLAFNEIIAETHYEREFFVTIFLTRNPNEHVGMRAEIMLEIFKKCFHFKILHAVIIQQELEAITSYTYTLSNGFCNGTLSITQVNQYKNGKLDHDYLFSPKIANFHKCALKVSANVLRPIFDFHGERNNPAHLTDVTRLTGVEGYLLANLAKHFNFSVYLNFPKERSELIVNGNSTGCYGELEAQKAHIAIGAFSGTLPGRHKFSTTVVYHQIPYVFAVRTGLNFGPLKQLAGPFCYGAWLGIGITFLIALIAIKLFRIYGTFIIGTQHVDHPYTKLLTIFLGNPIIRTPQRNFARFLLMSWLLLTLVIRSAYQGKMFDALRVSRRISTPKTISELLRRDYTLLSPTYVDYYPHNKTILMENIAVRASMTDSKGKLYTLVALEDNLAYYNFMKMNSSNLTFVPEPIHMHHMVMYFKKHSALKYILDPKIKQLMTFGIISFIARQHANRRFQTLNVGLLRLPRISNEMLLGLYTVYATLVGLSWLCFMLELLTRRVNRIKVIFDSVHQKAEQK